MRKKLSLTLVLLVLVGCSFSKDEINTNWSYEIETSDGEYILMNNDKEIRRFEYQEFNDIEIDEKKDGSAIVKYWNGGPEGGDETITSYSNSGEIILETKTTRPFDINTYISRNGIDYKVSSIVKNQCDGDISGQEGYDTTKLLTGLKISIGELGEFNEFTVNSQENFSTDNEYKTECSIIDGSLRNPTISVKELLDNKVVLEFLGGEIELIFSQNQYPEVKFK